MFRFRIVENYNQCVKHILKMSIELIEIINSIYNCTKAIKYLGINLTKCIQDLCAENCKAPKKERN